MEKTRFDLSIEGMTCTACSSKIEKVLNQMDGVEANVHLALEKAFVSINSKATTSADVIDRIEDLGYEVKTDTVLLDVYGMTCSACSARIEKVLNKMEGVRSANVNLAAETASIHFEEGIISAPDIIDKIKTLGYDAKVRESRPNHERHHSEHYIGQKQKLILSAVLSLPLLYTMVSHLPGGLALPVPRMLMNPWLQLGLAAPVQFYIGWPFYKGAYQSL